MALRVSCKFLLRPITQVMDSFRYAYLNYTNQLGSYFFDTAKLGGLAAGRSEQACMDIRRNNNVDCQQNSVHPSQTQPSSTWRLGQTK